MSMLWYIHLNSFAATHLIGRFRVDGLGVLRFSLPQTNLKPHGVKGTGPVEGFHMVVSQNGGPQLRPHYTINPYDGDP